MRRVVVNGRVLILRLDRRRRASIARKLCDARQVSKHRSLNQMSLSTVLFVIASWSKCVQFKVKRLLRSGLPDEMKLGSDAQ